MATNKEKQIAGAQKLVEKGQFEKAIKEYLRVVADDDKDVRVWLKIGDLYAKLGKKPEAAETYSKVAQFYSDQGFYLKAVAVYKQIVKIEPRLVEVNHKLAELYKQLGLLSDAMQQYEAVAAFYQREGNTREALNSLKQIVELDPDTVANRIKLAELYSKENLLREATDELARAAEQLRQAGRTDDFMKVAERLLFHAPENRPVTKELAALYIEKGDPRRALPKLQVCFKADPRDTEVLALLAQAFEALEQHSKAVSVLKELARILGENGDARARESAWRKILDLSPSDAEAQAALALRAPAPVEGAPTPARRLDSTASRPALATEREAAPAWDATPMVESEEVAIGVEEEVAKILNETDVYIKYNLHAKAVEHLQRAFERSPNHVGAREKLKALYLILGKKDEAILELWSLVEHAEPGRKRRYLREILEIDPQHARAAAELGERVSAPELAVEPAAELAPMRDPGTSELLDSSDLEELSEEEFDLAELSQVRDPLEEDELIPVVVAPAHDPLATPPPEEEDRFGLDSEPVEDRFGFADESPVPLGPSDSESIAIDAGLDAAARQAETPFAERPTRFDADPLAYDDPFAPATRFNPEPLPYEEASVEVDEADLPPVDPDWSGTARTPSLAEDLDESVTPPAERAVTRTVQTPVAAAIEEVAPVGTALEDDLDEADFFVQQNLFEEARGIFQVLLQRYPNHPLVMAKLRDLEATAGAAAPSAAALVMEELHSELPPLAEVLPDPSAGFEVTRKGVIEKGVTAEDFETHYDLGIAYKEMGLLDDAIGEFRIVIKDPAREVQCHLMIGLCFLEKGIPTDAVGQFKKGLYVEGITDREALSLYYELGQAYEQLGDPREAMYYYEKVIKRDPQFRDVERRVQALRGGVVTAVSAPLPDRGEEVEAAFDTLLGKDA